MTFALAKSKNWLDTLAQDEYNEIGRSLTNEQRSTINTVLSRISGYSPPLPFFSVIPSHQEYALGVSQPESNYTVNFETLTTDERACIWYLFQIQARYSPDNIKATVSRLKLALLYQYFHSIVPSANKMRLETFQQYVVPYMDYQFDKIQFPVDEE
eukprot:3937847-Rhodomonas_salina.1